MPDLYKEVADLKESCSESKCNEELMNALKDSDNKLFQPLAEAHELVSAADEAADATAAQTRRRKRGADQGSEGTVQQ